MGVRPASDGPVAQLGARLNGIQEVTGSTPVRSTKFSWYFPVTWVTDYSDHIGNTFEPKGFSIGSTRPASSSK